MSEWSKRSLEVFVCLSQWEQFPHILLSLSDWSVIEPIRHLHVPVVLYSCHISRNVLFVTVCCPEIELSVKSYVRINIHPTNVSVLHTCKSVYMYELENINL